MAISSLAGTLLALAAGIFVTRPAGAKSLPVARSIVNIGQTFPPVAVLARWRCRQSASASGRC